MPVYGSGGFTSYSLEQLQEQLGGWVAAGIPRVKMKIGRDPGRRPRRASGRPARRSAPDAELFVDANGAYSRKQALAQAERFAELGVSWFEEPVSSDDLEGLRLLRDRAPAGMDIAAGEYGYDLFYFRRMLEAGAVDVLRPMRRAAAGSPGSCASGRSARRARCRSRPTARRRCTSTRLRLPRFRHLEYFHDHDRIEHMLFDGAPTPVGGALRPDLSRPGLGLEFKRQDAAALRRLRTEHRSWRTRLDGHRRPTRRRPAPPQRVSRPLFVDAAALAAELRQAIRGEVRFDAGSRALYATDGSNYRQVPIGVVIPRDVDDVIETVDVCRAHGAPILSRGGGTSLAGSAATSRSSSTCPSTSTRSSRSTPTASWRGCSRARVLDVLRTQAEKHHLTFGPDPSTHTHCTLGGMIGNNSCGVHSLMGLGTGRTADQVDELEILLYDGTRMTVGATTEDELERIIRGGRPQGEIYARLQGPPRPLRRRDPPPLSQEPAAPRLRLQPRRPAARERLPRRPGPVGHRGHLRHRCWRRPCTWSAARRASRSWCSAIPTSTAPATTSRRSWSSSRSAWRGSTTSSSTT